MAVKVKNSLTTLLEQALILEKNQLETVAKINDATVSNADSISISITNPADGTSQVVNIPSFGYLKNAIERIDSNINSIANINSSGSTIKLSDGSYRNIISSKIPSEAPTVTKVNNVTNFNFRSNWFFEEMLNPCLYITMDLTNQISASTERVMIQRYILDCDTDSKKEAFNTYLNGKSNIDYKQFLQFILKYKIYYTLDDEVKDMPPRGNKYTGYFTVRSIRDVVSGNKKTKRYKLSSLAYTNNATGFENTAMLSVGDYVLVNKQPISTKYKVTLVDNSTYEIEVEKIEGYDNIEIGVNSLKISSEIINSVSAEIPIGYDERQVIFVKPIDPDSHIPADKWSPGVAFYSNELTYVDANGNTQTLQSFYQRNVVDFGQVLLSYASDYYPSSREGIKPNAPVLNYTPGDEKSDFRVEQINKHLSEVSNSEDMKALISSKGTVESELIQVQKDIETTKTKLNTTNFGTSEEKLTVERELNAYIEKESSLSSRFNSIVTQIKASAAEGGTMTPKYRVRGFWEIPASKVSPSSGEQKIIKFIIRYRYLSESGNTNNEGEYNYNSGNSVSTGRFSNWIEVEGKLRERVLTQTGWEWAAIDTSNPEEININQLDIPIQKGEQVEIQVRSVSEAGYPNNPMKSDWSNSIIVNFSDFSGLEGDDISDILSQNVIDAAVANITQQMSNINSHTRSSFYNNEAYFAHTAESIASGFKTSEQNHISLYDKLHDLQNQIDQLREQINNNIGNLIVKLYDPSDNNRYYTLTEGTTIEINAGNYSDEIAKLAEPEKNGAIITKTFYIDISSDAASGLRLLSKLNGNRTSMCPSTIYNDGNLVIDDEPNGNHYSKYDNILSKTSFSGDYYKNIGRYDLVPINVTNPSDQYLDYQIESPSMYQSAQCRGQFIYSRFRNIGNTFDMYANGTDKDNIGEFDYKKNFNDSEVEYKVNSTEYQTIVDYFMSQFEGETTIENYEGVFNYLKSKNAAICKLPRLFTKINPLSTKQRLNLQRANISNGSSIISNVKIQPAYGYTEFKLDEIPISSSEKKKIEYATTHKIGYDSIDRYAIGPDSCGSYLFLSPTNHTAIQVEGDSVNSSISTTTSIRVPLVYQFRMSDVEGYTFGDKNIKKTDRKVQDTIYANIIGLDIWTNTNTDSPNQYDIIVWSSYLNRSINNSGGTTNKDTFDKLSDDLRKVVLPALERDKLTSTPSILIK